ncbi:MAG: M28 family metallopeptidase [Mycobacteriales bacterium]
MILQRSAIGRVSAERMRATVATLAGEEFAGRRVGSRGGRAAREWLAGQLAELGGGPAVRVQEFTVAAVPELTATPSLAWTGGPELRHRRDFVEHLATADQPAPLRGGVVGPAADDWSGRWVLVPAGFGTGLAVLARRAGTEGARGLLVQATRDAGGWLPKRLAGPAAGPVPILAVAADHHAELARAATGDGEVEVTASVPLRRVPVPAANLVAPLGRPSSFPVEVLLCAHHDGVGDDPRLRLPAASDNATGVAVVLEAARLLAAAPPAGLGVQVALLDGEETGADGSAYHAAQLVAAGRRPLVINVDGAGRLEGAAAVEAGGPAHPLLAALDQAGRQAGVALRAGPVASDNRRYAAAGLGAVGIGAGMPGYHSPADTAERVEASTLVALARLVVTTVWMLADRTGQIHRQSSIID